MHAYISLGSCYSCCAGPCEKASQRLGGDEPAQPCKTPQCQVDFGRPKAQHSLVQVKMCLFGHVLQQRGKKTSLQLHPRRKIRSCEHGRQRDQLGWEPGIFHECFQSPKAVFPSLLTALNSLAQSARLLLCAHSFTQCSWAYLSEIIT